MKNNNLSIFLISILLSTVACNSNKIENERKSTKKQEFIKEKETVGGKTNLKTDSTYAIMKTSATFPESWDPKRTLRGDDEVVLAWTHKQCEGSASRTCLLFRKSTDTHSKPVYFLSEEFSTEPPFNKWKTGFIYFAPEKNSTSGFYDSHLQLFDHKPTRKEIYDLLEQWKFQLFEDNYTTIEAGTDKQLWQDLLGFTWEDQP